MAGLIQKSARRFTTQIGAAGVADAAVTTIPLVSVTGLPTNEPIELIIDRSDSSGTLTPSKEEVVRGTISGTNLINCTRGVEGTAQAHSAGATVNALLTASMWNNMSQYIRDMPSRGLIGGIIQPTVASNNLTVAIKTLAGNDPSVNEPVYVWINNTLRSITSALSTSANAGFNLFNSGSAELATREIDYFAYIGNRTSDNTLFIGFSRIPYARVITDFSDTASNERYVRFGDGSFNPSAVIGAITNIGRFAATLSAGAGHTWSVPAFTNANLIQEPIYETRRLSWQITFTGAGSGTLVGQYRITNSICHIWFSNSNITIASANPNLLASIPINSVVFSVGHVTINDNNYVTGRIEMQANSNSLGIKNSAGVETNWTVGTAEVYLQHYYTIQ